MSLSRGEGLPGDVRRAGGCSAKRKQHPASEDCWSIAADVRKGMVLANTLGRATSGTAEKESNQSASERRSPGNTKPFLPSFLASTSNPEQRQLTRQEDGRMLPALVN